MGSDRQLSRRDLVEKIDRSPATGGEKPVEQRPETPPYRPVASFADEVAGLKGAHAEQRDAIAALHDEHLTMKVGNGMPMGEFLAMATRHDTWHAAQIAVARRMYRSR